MDQVSCPSAVRIGQLNAQSIGNKYAVLSNLIKSINYDFFAITETWHDSATCPELIACTPRGYSCVERARPRKKTLSVATNHGGVCLFYKSTYTVRRINMPVYSSAEFLAVSAYNSSAKQVLVVIYRPGSVAANSLFFDEFAAVVDRLAVYAIPVVIVGD